METGRTTTVSLLLAACMLAVGCADPLAHRTASFAAAGAPAIADTSAAFALVQSNHAAAVLAEQVQAFDAPAQTSPHGSAPRAPVLFGSKEDLQVRAQIFALLTSYVSGLRTVSGGKPDAGAGATAAAGEAAAAALADDDSAIAALHTPSLSNSQLTAAAAAIGKIEGLLADHARRRALPRILAGADPAIAAICLTLRRDIGTPGSPGLRSQLALDFRQRILLAGAAIRDHKDGYSYPEREHAIRNLYTLMDTAQQADAVLAQTDALLASFAAAHHALALSASHAAPADFKKQLGALALQAKELADAEKTVVADGKDLP